MYPIVCSWEKSGQSQKDFCRSQQIPTHLLTYWLQRYRNDSTIPVSTTTKQVCFAEIRPETPFVSTHYVRIQDAQGRSIEFGQSVSSSFLRDLLSW
jgi:hypothetical protein